jgi:site-specific recombinase XerD
MMHLLFSTGMRRDELFKARLGHLKRVLVDGKTCHLLKVTGKRSKVREVLIEPEIMQLVLEHLADRPASFNDDLATQPGRDAVPFVSVLRDPLRTYLRKPEGDSDSELVESGMVVDQRELADTHGALSPDGMLSQIKAFFSKCASKCHEAGLDSSDFERATLHWLRHSFGHSMVDANVDVRVVQRALGHANINTTAHYSKADMVQMVRGLRQGAASIQRQTANSQLIEDRENVGPSISNTP